MARLSNHLLFMRLVLCIAFVLTVSPAGLQATQQASRGWGSSWTDPHTVEEKQNRDLGERLERAVHKGDWMAVDKALAEAAQRFPRSAEIPYLRSIIATFRHRYDEALSGLNRTLALVGKGSPQSASSAYALRSYVYQLKGDYRSGRADLERAIALHQDNLSAHNSYAWLLATCPDARVRDGKRAVQFARAVNRKTGNKVPSVIDTLAAAEAEAGDLRAAVKNEQRALSLAKSERSSMERHLKAFQNGQALRVPADPPELLRTPKKG